MVPSAPFMAYTKTRANHAAAGEVLRAASQAVERQRRILHGLAVVAASLTLACTGAIEANGGSSSEGASTDDSAATVIPSTSDPGTTTIASDDSGGASAGSSDTSGGGDTGEPPLDDACAAYDAFAQGLAEDGDDAARDARRDAFLRTMWRSDEGLPIRCDGRMVVLFDDDGGAAWTVTGDFADWDPTAHPLEPIVAGYGLRVADIAIDEPLAPSLYKLVRDGTDYVADPWARRFGWDEFGEYSLTAAREDASHHERYPAFDDALASLQPRRVVVYVPAGALSQQGLPVLYMHDGQNLFDPAAAYGGWRVGAAIDDAIANGDMPTALVVAIDNTSDRFDEYGPSLDDIGGGPVGGRADEYADFLVDGVIPFVDERYPTAADRSMRGVLGSSMGGLVSLYIAWRHPEAFAAAGSMSGTLGWGQIGADNDRVLDLYEASPPDDVWIYLDSGGNPPCPRGSDNYCVTVEMRDALVGLGWSEGDGPTDTLAWLHAPGATHDEAAWAARLPGFLALLGPRWAE